jgi:hypothetical protein
MRTETGKRLEPVESLFILHVMSASVEVGKNEALFRAVNERIRDVSDDFGPSVTIEFICECSRHDCMSPVPLTLTQYAEVRSESTWFAVVPGHLWDEDSEHLVSKQAAYWVLEKDGVAAVAADAADE